MATKIRTVDIVYIALFAAIMAICSWISIPTVVPFTLQTFGVFLTIGLLGGKRGTAAVLVYLLLGLVGAPVFAGFKGGAGVLMGSTGGYIIGFALSALVMWAMERIHRKWALPLSMVVGLVVMYAFGTVWFALVYTHTSFGAALMTCVVPYLLPDAAKIVLACLLVSRLKRYIK